jgi:hypothetical protein
MSSSGGDRRHSAANGLIATLPGAGEAATSITIPRMAALLTWQTLMRSSS